MKFRKKRTVACAALLSVALGVQAQDVPVETGNFSPDWNSLSAWQCPEWFKDAKFGIWAHWGPQCEAEDGDWYARGMYFAGSGQYNWHVSHYGEPEEFGFKDLCNAWKADEWDPESLVELYKSVGARYFFTLGQHHDNFDLWNSPYQPWNSVNIGPKKDIVKGWSDACKKNGLPLGISMHGSHTWTWFEVSQDYDGNLTKEDGNGKWWEGYDPQDLYAQRHTPSIGYDESGTINSQWDWGEGASLPSEAFKTKFKNRVLECINDYNPDMLYFDDTVLPFYGCDDNVGLDIVSHYYNHSANQNNGDPQVVVMGKKLETNHKQALLWDVERGVPDRIQTEYWQTCTCLGSWHYDTNTYKNGSYKSAQQVVDMLVDIVSKNGNLLLSVPIKGNGTIDEKERAILEGIKAWMDVNALSIYGTRPWKTFGEGPLADASNPLTSQGFNESNNYSSKDVRYAQRNDSLFATIMRWPSAKRFTFESLGASSTYYSGHVKSVELLGYGKVDYEEAIDGLTVTLPEKHPNEIAPVFCITFEEGDAQQASLEEVIASYETKVASMLTETSYNTGKFSKQALLEFREKLENAKQYTHESEANQQVVKDELLAAYKALKENGRNAAGAPSLDGAEDATEEYLTEASNFSASEQGSRFGTPQYWTVENYYVPMKDTSKGVKNGIDNYPGFPCLALGIWGSEDATPYTCDLSNARIYNKVHLAAGRYFFGAQLQSYYNLTDNAYIFAAESLLNTEEIPDGSIAFAQINKVSNMSDYYGVYFTLKEDADVYLGFQADMANGSTEQETRIQGVTLLYYGNMDFTALETLIYSAEDVIANATVNSNTGYYKQDAVDALQAAHDAAEAMDYEATQEEFTEAYNTLNEAIKNFQENGKNVGGAPLEGLGEDITIEKLHECDNFARTPETDDGDRFGAPKYWTVENYGFGDQAGIDNHPGYDCLHLEVWWNNSAYAENGYDIKNVRLYQRVTLPEGRYFFGAAYPTAEANDELYIFASSKLVNTSDISTQTIAYEKVNVAPTDGSFRGIYFTLNTEQEVYLGFQSDFSGSVTNNLRAKSVKLVYYGQMTYEKLTTLIETIEDAVAKVKVNENTGFYSKDALSKLQAVIDEARALGPSSDYEIIETYYNALNEAYTDFQVNGKNDGGQPEKMNAVDVTEEYLVEASGFSRADNSVTTRFATPAYWTVENFMIDNGSSGVKNGIDKYPGYSCLSLGLWDDRDNNSDGDLKDARIYREVELPAGRYYFGASYNTTYALTSNAYIFAAESTLETEDIPNLSIAYYPINKASDNDGLLHGVFFTLEEPQKVILGFQADLANGTGEQEFRASEVSLIRYTTQTAVEMVEADVTSGTPVYYNLSGVRLQRMPNQGFFIVRVGNKSYKCFKR